MDKKISLVIAIIGLAILLFNIFQTVSTKSSESMFLLPVGLLLAISGSGYYIFKSRKDRVS
jgi:hypothetical protein